MKDIKGYEGIYAITSCGRVWSYKRGKFLKPRPDKDGYLRVNLCLNYKQKTVFIHRLVAEAYLPNPDNLPEVNHKDEIKTHNWINNLEWCTRLYNINYGTKVERMLKTRAKTRGKKIICVETGEIFNSQKEAAEKYGISQGNLSRACRGIIQTCGGYHWRFVEPERGEQ